MTTEYGLQISPEIENQILRCRASVRTAIKHRLREIAVDVATSRARPKTAARTEPPLRFYVYEGYRIVYQLDPASRQVVVLGIDVLPVE